MGRTAEAVARKYGVSREQQDEFAVESQRRAATDAAKAAFAEEITPVETGGRRSVTVTEDEHPKPGTTVETLAKLRPAFEEADPSPPVTRRGSTTAPAHSSSRRAPRQPSAVSPDWSRSKPSRRQPWSPV